MYLYLFCFAGLTRIDFGAFILFGGGLAIFIGFTSSIPGVCARIIPCTPIPIDLGVTAHDSV